MGTLAYAAKRALRDLLVTQFAISDPDVDVQYSATPEMGEKTIYFGGFTFTQADQAAERGAIVNETDQLSIYLRAGLAGDDVEGVETVVESMVATLTDVIVANPKLAGGLTVTALTGGRQADPQVYTNPEPYVVATLQLTVTVQGDP